MPARPRHGSRARGGSAPPPEPGLARAGAPQSTPPPDAPGAAPLTRRLSSAQRDGPLTEHQAATVLWEVLKVVSACHSSGVCHGAPQCIANLIGGAIKQPAG